MDKEGKLRYPNWHQRTIHENKTGMWYQTPEEDYSDLPEQHHLARGEWLNDTEKLRRNIWPWEKGIRSRLPEHYKRRYMERFSVEPIPVHYRPADRKWRQDEHGVIHRIPNRALPVYHPTVSNEGLWGGEGIITGLHKRKDNPMKENSPKVWMPNLIKRVFYSEILDMYMAVVCTHRTLDLVDEACGFDSYILQNHEVDLRSRLGMRIKQNMMYKILSLEKDNELYKKYSQYLIPVEEISWLGLQLHEAEDKQKHIEEKEQLTQITPLKLQLSDKLIERLQNDEEEDEEEEEEEKSFLSRLNPFKDKKEAD